MLHCLPQKEKADAEEIEVRTEEVCNWSASTNELAAMESDVYPCLSRLSWGQGQLLRLFIKKEVEVWETFSKFLYFW